MHFAHWCYRRYIEQKFLTSVPFFSYVYNKRIFVSFFSPVSHCLKLSALLRLVRSISFARGVDFCYAEKNNALMLPPIHWSNFFNKCNFLFLFLTKDFSYTFPPVGRCLKTTALLRLVRPISFAHELGSLSREKFEVDRAIVTWKTFWVSKALQEGHPCAPKHKRKV